MRKSKGRQKVEMAKMAKESNLQVTFSKRRSGLFKKASELCTLCGAEIAVIVFSPGKKVYSFGHPGVETIIDRFLTRNPSPSSSSLQLLEAHRSANVRDLNVLLTQVLSQLEGERKFGEELAEMRKACQARYWWAGPVEELSFERLELLKVSLENLKKNVAVQLDTNMMIMKAADHHPATFFPPLSVGAGLQPFDGQMLRLDPRSFNLGYGGSLL